MRFRAQQRLRGASSFAAVRDHGFRTTNAAFILQLRLTSSSEENPVRRLGVIASRRVGNSVIRNRAKRLFREIFRAQQEILPDSCDLVIVVRRNFALFSLQKLENLFLQSLRRILRRMAIKK